MQKIVPCRLSWHTALATSILLTGCTTSVDQIPTAEHTQPVVTCTTPVHDLATSPPSLQVVGVDPHDRLGSTVATGDVDGDGIHDLVIGAHLADGIANSRPDAGEVSLFYGSTTVDSQLLTTADADFTLIGASSGDLLGIRPALATGDLNGDGYMDIIAGAEDSDVDGTRTDAGSVYVVFGGPALAGTLDLATDDADFTVHGDWAFRKFGTDVAAGDVNGDGFDDLIVGGDRHRGRVYVFFGSASLAGTVDLSQTLADITILTPQDGAFLGNTVAAGDVDGDGIDDMLMNAAFTDGPAGTRENAGSVHVFYGSGTLAGTGNILWLADADFTVHGAAPFDALGMEGSITTGDMDSDGIDDLIVGTPRADRPGRADSGAVYVIYRPATRGPVLDLATTSADITMLGADAADGLGLRSTIGDLDRDGRGDMVVSARWADGPGNTRVDAGEAYVFLNDSLTGSGTGAVIDLATATADITVIGAIANETLGGSVAIADVTGDDTPDLLVATIGISTSGAVSLFSDCLAAECTPTGNAGDWDYCSSSCPCGAGQGDCDSDDECAPGLGCAYNIGSDHGYGASVDVCIVRTDPGGWDHCSVAAPCAAGAGDCDDNDECGAGLGCMFGLGPAYGHGQGVDVCLSLTAAGGWDHCSEISPCGHGQGDCDRDAECIEGHRCVDQVGPNYGYGDGVDVCELMP